MSACGEVTHNLEGSGERQMPSSSAVGKSVAGSAFGGPKLPVVIQAWSGPKILGQVVRDLGLARAEDRDFFAAARMATSTVLTKDRDFADLVIRLGPPPGTVLLTCGNKSTAYVRGVLQRQSAEALNMIRAGEGIVEIRSAP